MMIVSSNYLHLWQALVALKKGTQLIKYSRKGKPKLCPFRVSTVSCWHPLFSNKYELVLVIKKNRTRGI